tara:strand:+ start:620 stop:721 length:102 start_codon:yes stop_codon:yes gene_type:complete
LTKPVNKKYDQKSLITKNGKIKNKEKGRPLVGF